MGKQDTSRLDLDSILDTLTAFDFVFIAVDDDDELCTYDALFSCKDPTDGTDYLVYADFEPAEHDEVATYASILLDPSQALDAQAAADAGSSPKKLPILDLAEITSEQGNLFVHRVLNALELVDD